MRLFIASPVILDDYTQIRKDFESIVEGRWVTEKNLHLTWIFLGETKDSEPIIKKLQTLRPLSDRVDIAALGYFGRPPRILYARADSSLLYDKAKEFREADFDLYRFKPHITLCRIKSIRNYRAYKEAVQHYREITLGTILPEIALYRSTLSSEGSDYTKLCSIEIIENQ